MRKRLHHLVFLLAICMTLPAEPWKPPSTDVSTPAEVSLSDAESERYQSLTNRVIGTANVRTELSDGFRYVLDSENTEPADVIEWMRLQRKSCPFVSYSLHFTSGGDLLLDLRGPDGVKELLQLELPPLAPQFI
ncbi:hypothetical protein [Paludibaculum fermentans]|uniref:hypothetical protein n=1 Tax=Paludibaculum fermentans TaxID=1473598 RepID=UPI003EBAC2AE